MDSVKSSTTRDLSSHQSGDGDADLTKSFKAAAGKPREDMVVPPPPPPPPHAPPPATGSPLSEAEELSANWGKWGMHNGVDFHNPPSGASPDEVSTLKYFAGNSVLYQAMIKDNGGTGNTLSKADVDQFISDAKGDAQAAADALPPDGTSSNSTLQNLSDIVTNWHAWGLHSGDTPFSNPPPSNLPPEAKSALGAITSNPYLLSQIGNHTGSGAITRDDVANFLKLASKNPVLLGVPPAQDTHVQGWLDSLGDAVSSQDKTQLGQTANDAQTVLDFFNAYPRNAPELNSEVPPDVAAAEQRLTSSDAVKKQITTSDGTITRDTLGAFLGNLDKAADSAKSSWESFQKSAPNADPTVTHMAADASILQADSPILDEAGAGSQPDGEVSTTDLEAVGHSDGASETQALNAVYGVTVEIHRLLPTKSPDPGPPPPPAPYSANGNAGDATLPSALKNAASLFSSPGMFANIDTAGDDPATTQPDGLMDAKNLGSFISDDVSKMTPTTMLDMIAGAADRNLTANVDVSKLGPDVFKNPQNYSGAQKAAVLQQLEDLDAKISAGKQENDWDTANLVAAYNVSNNINPNVDKVLADIQGKINQLSNDPDVDKFLSDGATGSMQSIVDADPGMKSALQGYSQGTFKDGSSLTDALNRKDSNGNPVSVEQGLQDFVGQASLLSQALGSNGKPASLNLQQVVQNSGQEDRLKQAYESDILSGNEFKNAIGDGSSASISTAVNTFTRDAANFGAVLPSDYISQNADKLQQTFGNTISDALLGTASNGELNAAFGDSNGNVDTAKLNDIIQQEEKQDPSAFKDADGNLIPPDKIVSTFKYVWDTVRQGNGKLPDALAKIAEQNWKDAGQNGPKPGKPTGPVAKAYSNGLMHAVSALFAGGILAAKGVEGGSDKATVSANLVAGSAQVIGGVMEAGSKYAKSTSQTALSGDALKGIENAGKAIGGAAGVISGALSIFSGVQALKDGQKPVAGIDIASGITGTWAGAAGLLEGGLGVAEALGVDGISAALPALAATTATLGVGAAVVGGLGALGLLIYEAVEDEKHTNAFNSQIAPQITQWGITGGPIEPGDAPEIVPVATE